MILDVYLCGEKIGTLQSTPDRGIVFSYMPSATRSLSLSLPILGTEYPEKNCMPFFSGLLPDGDMKTRIANQLHVSETSTFKLLTLLGGECAGAVTLLEEGAQYPETQNQYEPLAVKDIETMIDDIAVRPLLTGRKGLRQSLAGAQQKLPLALVDGKWQLPLQGSPSTHIIKPDSKVSSNEYVCLKLAEACGIPVPDAQLIHFGKHRTLVMARYDRIWIDGKIERLHQEDLCQALAIAPERKYEEDGGPGYNRILPLLVRYSALPAMSVFQVLTLMVFNYLIGNCDAHAKNFSLLYSQGAASPVLAPAYDLVSTTLYPELSTDMAMSTNGERRIDRLVRQDFLSIWDAPKLTDSIIKNLTSVFPKALSSLRENLDDGECLSVLEQIERQSEPRLHRL